MVPKFLVAIYGVHTPSGLFSSFELVRGGMSIVTLRERSLRTKVYKNTRPPDKRASIVAWADFIQKFDLQSWPAVLRSTEWSTDSIAELRLVSVCLFRSRRKKKTSYKGVLLKIGTDQCTAERNRDHRIALELTSRFKVNFELSRG